MPTGLGLASIDIQLWYKHVCISSSSLRPTMVAWPESSVSLFLIYKKNQITPIQQTAFCPQAKSLPLWTPIRTQAQNSGLWQRSVIRKILQLSLISRRNLLDLFRERKKNPYLEKLAPWDCVCVLGWWSALYTTSYFMSRSETFYHTASHLPICSQGLGAENPEEGDISLKRHSASFDVSYHLNMIRNLSEKWNRKQRSQEHEGKCVASLSDSYCGTTLAWKSRKKPYCKRVREKLKLCCKKVGIPSLQTQSSSLVVISCILFRPEWYEENLWCVIN